MAISKMRRAVVVQFPRHAAHVTFFVAGYENFSDRRTNLAELAALGHDVQSHGMCHLSAIDHVSYASRDPPAPY